MYWVQGKTRKANPVKKSLGDSKPATGLSLNPVHSTWKTGGRGMRKQCRMENNKGMALKTG